MTGIVEHSTENTILSNVPEGAVRYIAPEFIEDGNAPVTTGSDTFSFGMLMLGCITEKLPFYNLTTDAAVFDARIAGAWHPPRPDGPDPKSCVPDRLWRIMLRCWSIKWDDRLTMGQVHDFISEQHSASDSNPRNTLPVAVEPSWSLPPSLRSISSQQYRRL